MATACNAYQVYIYIAGAMKVVGVYICMSVPIYILYIYAAHPAGTLIKNLPGRVVDICRYHCGCPEQHARSGQSCSKGSEQPPGASFHTRGRSPWILPCAELGRRLAQLLLRSLVARCSLGSYQILCHQPII